MKLGTTMVQAIINLGEKSDRVLSIIKGKFGFKNKSEAVNYVIEKFEEELLEPELRPEYIEKIRKIEKKGKFRKHKNLDALRRVIENA